LLNSRQTDINVTNQAPESCEGDCQLRKSALLRQLQKYYESWDMTCSEPILPEFRRPISCRICKELVPDMDGLIDHLMDKPCGDECFGKMRAWEVEQLK